MAGSTDGHIAARAGTCRLRHNQMEELADNIAATDLRLSDTELKTLDEVSQLPPEYPGWMLDRQNQDRLPGGAIK